MPIIFPSLFPTVFISKTRQRSHISKQLKLPKAFLKVGVF